MPQSPSNRINLSAFGEGSDGGSSTMTDWVSLAVSCQRQVG
jgi:hypothetical protein